MLSKIHNSVIKGVWPFSPASGPALSVCSRGDAFMAMPQTVPPKEKASETFAFEFQKTQRMSLQTLLFQRACPLRLTFVRQIPPFVAARHLPPVGGSLSSKWEPLAVPVSFISLPRPLPLGEVDANAVSRRRGRARFPLHDCFRRKPARQLQFSSATPPVKTQCRTVRRPPGIALL